SVASKFEIVTSAARPVTVTTPLLLTTLITSLASVALITTVSTPPPVTVGCTEVDVDVPDVGLAEVVHRDGVVSPSCADVDRFHALGVHVQVANVAGQQSMAAICRQVDLLRNVGAVELQRIVARLPVDGVAALAGIPDEGVVTGAELGQVAALA